MMRFRFFQPSGTLLHVFERQFDEEHGQLVYRRYGKGPAYRVTISQRDELIEGYIRDYRKNHLLMIALLIIVMGGLALGLVLAEADPESTIYWLALIIPILFIASWFVWANHLAVTRPARVFARDVPIAPQLSSTQARRKSLSEISYGMLALSPMFGLLIVFLMSDEFNVWAGWGRSIWAVPIAFTALAAVQAFRKWRIDREA